MHPGNMKSLRNRSFCLYSMLLNAKLLRFSFKKMINGRISNKVRIFLGKLQHIIKSSPFLHFLILKCERCWEDMRGHDLRSLQGRWSPASRHPAPANLQRANYIQPWPLVLLHQTSRICEKKKKEMHRPAVSEVRWWRSMIGKQTVTLEVNMHRGLKAGIYSPTADH